MFIKLPRTLLRAPYKRPNDEGFFYPRP